jgi:plasmid stabilization system protein ParE
MKPMMLHADAEAELRDAMAYYEARKEGLGGDFRKEIEAALGRIAANPLRFAEYRIKGIRECPVKRFPYALYYRELSDSIWVAAVAHQKRRPGYWSRRKRS